MSLTKRRHAEVDEGVLKRLVAETAPVLKVGFNWHLRWSTAEQKVHVKLSGFSR